MMEQLSAQRTFDGTVSYFSHPSVVCQCDMRFSIFIPESADASSPAPVVWWLSGLTCTEDNFTVKAGAYKAAAEHGLILIAPDTSPRGANVPNVDAYDLGQGAGFYLDATESPWSQNFQMYSYIGEELQALVAEKFPVDSGAQGISGHSMGGHGALTIGLKYPDRYRSLSAFAPIVAPCQVPWGQQAFTAYLGEDRDVWKQYDATELMLAAGDRRGSAPILIDQGLADDFLDEQLRPELFEAACAAAGQDVEVRRQVGYDHSYFFISSFIDDHVAHHAKLLRA